MRSDVLQVISAAKDVTNAVILTHNIDFVFIQTVVLSAFRRCGHPTITILADARCAAESYSYQEAVVTGLGVRYRVVPIEMGHGFRFHPKAVLLSSEETGTLLVGSGNLTFGGWRENAEVWTHFESGSDGAGAFLAFRSYLSDVIGRVVLPEAVEREVDTALDPKSKKWLSAEATGDSPLVGRVGSGGALLDRMLEASAGNPIDELFVCAPYFDAEGIALQELVSKVGASNTTVLYQPGRSTLRAQAWRPNAARARLQGIEFSHTDSAGEKRSAFVHAKFYGFRRADEVVVLSGSANCSRAALTVQGQAGNAELMAVRVLAPQEFEEEFLGELDLLLEPVVFTDEPQDEIDEPSEGAKVRVLAARFESDCLLVGYSPPSVTIAECLVDGETAPFVQTEKGVVSVSCAGVPRLVMVRARVDGELIESAPAWIDIERQLRKTAHSRSLADSIRARVQAGSWGHQGWAQLLNVFCKYLAFMPAVPPSTLGPQAGNEGKHSEREFTEADVFAPDYRAPKLGKILLPASFGRDQRVQSLQQLLLRNFDVEEKETKEDAELHEDKNEPNGDDVVDRPKRLPATPVTEATFTKRNKRQIARLLDQMERAMTSSEFLKERSPDYLARDLKVASVLLCVGLREGWVERQRFFSLTQKIWSCLFFSGALRKEVGWLEFRAAESDGKTGFEDKMRSARLSAALMGWYLAVSTDDLESPELVRFVLAAVLAVARLPWLWHGGSQEEISGELAALMAHTRDDRLSEDELRNRAEAEWNQLLQRGQALRRLEAAVRSISLDEIRKRIHMDRLAPGELLWQGRAGFCVVLPRSRSSRTGKVTVLKLQGDGAETEFLASSTVPMRALLNEEVVPRTQDFGDEPRRVLDKLIRELSTSVLR